MNRGREWIGDSDMNTEAVNAPAVRYSKAPCAKCGAYKVTCSLEDESDGCGTYYDIRCEACGDAYTTDGPDA